MRPKFRCKLTLKMDLLTGTRHNLGQGRHYGLTSPMVTTITLTVSADQHYVAELAAKAEARKYFPDSFKITYMEIEQL